MAHHNVCMKLSGAHQGVLVALFMTGRTSLSVVLTRTISVVGRPAGVRLLRALSTRMQRSHRTYST